MKRVKEKIVCILLLGLNVSTLVNTEMNLLHPSHSRRRTPNASLSPTFIPNELVTDVLSHLTVKPLLRLRCVCKSWNSLISDPTFVKLHLHRSSQNAYYTLVSGIDFIVASFRFDPLFKNSPIIFKLPKDPYYQSNNNEFQNVVGSCNGLICLVGSSRVNENIECWFRIWNPATRTLSRRLGSFRDDLSTTRYNFTFGFDKSNNTYKVVALTRKIRVFTLQDNAWRNIQNPPEVHYYAMAKLVYLSGSVNWLAIHNHFGLTNKPFVIISLDLVTETYTQLLPPEGEVSFINHNLTVLNDCLCFSHDFKQTHFVIWKMKEFGDENSWTQFLKISYNNLQIDYPFNGFNLSLLPLCYSEKNDTLLLTNQYREGSILYNWKDNTLEKIHGPWFYTCVNFVESLVSYC